VPRIYYPGKDPETDPKLKRELRMDQVEAIGRTYRECTAEGYSRSVLIGAGMGSGKTVVSVEVILKMQKRSLASRVLVVGVRDAYSQWAEAWDSQGGTGTIRRVINTAAGRHNLAALMAGEDGIFYVGLEMLRAQDWETVSETFPVDPDLKRDFPELFPDDKITHTRSQQKYTFANMKPVDLLISDEAHKHSNQKSQALDTMYTIQTAAKIALSGTFFGNQFINAWSLTTWLWGKAIIGSQTAFKREYCLEVKVLAKDGTQLRYKNGFGMTKIVGEREPGEFVETLPCYVFIATPIGPVPNPEIVLFDLGREQLRQYDEMEKRSLTWIPTTKGPKHEPLIAEIPLTQRLRLRTAALGGMTLVPGADEDSPDSITFMPDCVSATLNEAYKVLHRPTWIGKKALILTHSLPFAIETARRIGKKYTVALKNGQTTSRVWDDEKGRFMLPVGDPQGIQYLVAVISAVGTAMDGLQFACSKVLWLSEDENNTNNMQGSNRVWRQGVDLDDYEAVKLVARGTIAQGILRKNLAHKDRTLTSVAGSK